MQPDKVKDAVKAYILDEFLPGEDPNQLTDSTPLITGGILDSISTVKLVAFLEARFGVAFRAHEMSADHLDTIADVSRIVGEKLTEK
jgi:acyl carrier protein